jgi:hypothetical protein
VCKSLISEERKKPNSKWMPLSDDTPIKKNTDQVIVDENKREYGSNYKIDTDDEDEV